MTLGAPVGALAAPLVPLAFKIIAWGSSIGAGAAAANTFLSDKEIIDTWKDRSTWNANMMALNTMFEKTNANMDKCGPTWDQYSDGFRLLWQKWHVFYTAEGNRSWISGDPNEAQVTEARLVAHSLSQYLININRSVKANCPDNILNFPDVGTGDPGEEEDLPIDASAGSVAEQQAQQARLAKQAADTQNQIDNLREGKDPNAPRKPPTDWGAIAKNAVWVGGGLVGVLVLNNIFKFYKLSKEG